MSAALGTWPALTLDEGQVQWVLAGRAVPLTPAQTAALVDVPAERVRLLDPAGDLVALARPGAPGPGLHADIVLR